MPMPVNLFLEDVLALTLNSFKLGSFKLKIYTKSCSHLILPFFVGHVKKAAAHRGHKLTPVRTNLGMSQLGYEFTWVRVNSGMS